MPLEAYCSLLLKVFLLNAYISSIFMSNNALGNFDCPPLMSDGRHITDYRPSSHVQELIKDRYDVHNHYDLKQVLQNQGLEIQRMNHQYYLSKNNCYSCGGYYLPDPNGHAGYWDRYGHWINYGQTMTGPDTQPNLSGCPSPPSVPTISLDSQAQSMCHLGCLGCNQCL
jgi:hypothetical protein